MSVPCDDFPWFREKIGPFRYRFCENFESLVESVGTAVPNACVRVRRAWNVLLRYRQDDVIFKVYEEVVDVSSPNCEQCRCNGDATRHLCDVSFKRRPF